MTYDAWRDLVLLAYQGGEPTHAAIIMAIKDGARSVMVRDIESDLALSKSYQASFQNAKVEMAGTRLTDDIADVIVEVSSLMPVDATTDTMIPALENAIAAAVDDFNAQTDRFDAYLRQATIDLQRHVPFYQVRQMTSYLLDGSGVTTDAFISRIDLPEGARIQQLWYGHYYPELEADVAYEADDIVVSNGRLYQVKEGGTLTVYQIGEGLTSTDGDDEELGDLVFRYYGGDRDWPVRQINWNSRFQMQAGQMTAGPCYALPPQRDEIWLYPALDEDHRFDLEWVGVTEDFDDSDEVTFDKTAAEAAAHYIRGMLTNDILGDRRALADRVALYQRAIRKAIVDNQARDTGNPTSVAPYDWTRRPRLWGSCCSVLAINSDNSTTVVCPLPNGYATSSNSIGDTLIAFTASNMTVEMTISGGARTSKIILRTTDNTFHTLTSGDTLKLLLTLPATASIELDVRNGTASGAQLLPDQQYPDGLLVTDGVVLSATLNFVFNGTAWEYAESTVPA